MLKGVFPFGLCREDPLDPKTWGAQCKFLCTDQQVDGVIVDGGMVIMQQGYVANHCDF